MNGTRSLGLMVWIARMIPGLDTIIVLGLVDEVLPV